MTPDRTVTVEPSRAVSDVIGFILIFSLVASVVAIVSVAGLDSLQSTRDAEQTNNAERAMEVFSDNVADIYERGAPSRATEISLGDAQLFMGEPISVRINNSGGDAFENRSYSVRPVVYRGADDTELVYAMGAVFRDQTRGGVVLREWSPRLTGDAVAVPVVNTTSKGGATQSVTGSTVLVRAKSQERAVTVGNESYNRPWTLRIKSPRSDLWQRMLDDRSGVDCALTGAGDAVVCDVQASERLYVVHHRIVVNIQR